MKNEHLLALVQNTIGELPDWIKDIQVEVPPDDPNVCPECGARH
jgi:hypothetical protein